MANCRVSIRIDDNRQRPPAYDQSERVLIRRRARGDRSLAGEGRTRRALALIYRGSVEAMAARIGSALVPGATESECLRASRRMPDPLDRAAFARVVRVWQLAAYAQRLPRDEEFESLLGELSLRFGWAR